MVRNERRHAVKQRRQVMGIDDDADEEEHGRNEAQNMQGKDNDVDKQHEATERPAKHHKSSEGASSDSAGLQHPGKLQQTGQTRQSHEEHASIEQQKHVDTDDKQSSDEALQAQPVHAKHTGATTAVDNLAATPFAAVTADPGSEPVPVTCDSTAAVRHSSRQLKPSKARQASSVSMKAASSIQALGIVYTEKPPKKPKTKKETADLARIVWPDVPEAEWGQGAEGYVDEKPAAPVTTDPPEGAAAVGWGIWQYFEQDNEAAGDADGADVDSSDADGEGGDSSDAEDAEEGKQSDSDNGWFRGVVYWYDRHRQLYWCCFEDGEFIEDQKVDEWHKYMRKGEVILCRPPIQQQQQQQHGQRATADAPDRQQKKRKRSSAAPQQQQTEGVAAALDAETAAAAAVKVEESQQAARSSPEPPAVSASEALALVMPSTDAGQGKQHAKQEHKPDDEQRQPQQRHKQQAQRKGVAGGGKARQQQQQPLTSPRAAGPAKDAAAAASTGAAPDLAATGTAQRPRSAGSRQQQQQQQQLDLGSLADEPRMLAESLQQLQQAHSQLRRAQQQVATALKAISTLVDADALAFASIAKDMRQGLDTQQQEQQEEQVRQQAKPSGPGTRLCCVLKNIKEDRKQQELQAEAGRCFDAMKKPGAATPAAATGKQGAADGQQQQQRKAGGVGTTSKQLQQQSRPVSASTKAPVKQEVPPAVLAEKQEKEAAAAAAAAEIASLQAALKKQETALAEAERAAAERSQDLKLLDMFRELVPLQLLDNPVRNKAVAMLAALLHPPALMSPFAIAHQVEALLHEQHGLVGAGKHMYLQHLHLIWGVLGGRELEAVADAALMAEQQAEAAVPASHKLDAAEAALHAKGAAEAAAAAAKETIVVDVGIADPSAVRGALLAGKLTVPDLFHETAATLGFDQQRDK